MLSSTRTTRAALLGAGLVLIGAWLAACGSAATAQPASGNGTPAVAAPTAAPPPVDPDATAALTRMGAYLRTLSAFQVKSTTTRERVLLDGQKIQVTSANDLIVQRPNRLRLEATNDARHRFMFYDGTTFTLWADVPNFYATAPAPSTIAALITELESKFDIEVPLEDLFHWGESDTSTKAITAATFVGPAQIDGVMTDHYAFRQPGVDWQIWIQRGDHPLPRKLVITTMTDDARPQYASTLFWNLAPSFTEESFKFVPSPTAQKIRFAEIPGGSR
jgi:hypothetical protein